MGKQKIIKISFAILSVVLFLYLLTTSVKKAISDVSIVANASVQIYATNHAQQVFNAEVFRDYRACKKRAKKNKNIKNYVEYCGNILNEASIPDEGYLINISRKYYHYNWLSGTFSDKRGRIVYRLKKKDNYLRAGACLSMLASKIFASLFINVLLSILFYFALNLLKAFSTVFFKPIRNRVISGIIALTALIWYFLCRYNDISGGDAGRAILLDGGVYSAGDLSILLKMMITMFAALLVFKEFKIGRYSFWTICFAIIALIFNPLVPVFQFLTYIKLNHITNTLCEIFFVFYLIKEYKMNKNL